MRSQGLSITLPLELGGLTIAALRHLLGHPRRVCAPAKLAGLAVDRQRDRRPLFHSRLL
jgi:hypothetical protein